MHRVAVPLLSVLLLGGCTQRDNKHLLETYKANRHYHKQLIKTEKVHFYDANGTTKAVVTATYDNSSVQSERFVVGLYSDLPTPPHMTFRLNDKTPLEVKPLSEDTPRAEELSFVAAWKSFYEVRFPHTSAKRFTLYVTIDGVGEGKMYFAKKAKYTFEKKPF